MINAVFHTSPRRLLQACSLLLAAVCAQSLAKAEPAKPILVSTPASTRAIALEAVTLKPEPFSATTATSFNNSDKATRIMLFALNLSLQTGEDASTVLTADAEDAAQHHYNLKVEYVGKVAGEEWLSQVNLRLDETMSDVGDVLVQISYQGVASNRVRVGIGHTGGGPLDDEGAAPTPAPPYVISGRLTSGASAVSGVTVALSGTQTAATTTDSNGAYSFTVSSVGSYTITPSSQIFDSFPQQLTFNLLTSNQTAANFAASRKLYAINGQVLDDLGVGLDAVAVTLKSNADASMKVVTTKSGGLFSFTDVPAGYSYTVLPTDTSLDGFTMQSTSVLDRNLSFSFKGERRKYVISGVVADGQRGIDGVSVTLTGGNNLNPLTTVTTGGGKFSFINMTAGYDYTVTPLTNAFYTFNSREEFKNLLSDKGASFLGTLRSYTVSGIVTDENNKPLSNATVALYSGNNLVALVTVPDADGHYEFKDVPALYSYTVFPYYVPTHSFTAKTIPSLGQDETLNFAGVRYNFKISGVVSDRAQHGVGGISVTLSGAVNKSVTTDADGHYSFDNLQAGFDYQVTVAKTDFIFEPQARSYYLLEDEKTDFTAVRTYRISGRVMDGNGQGLPGMTMNLSGAETGQVLTASDGSYSMTVTTAGNYLLTPSKEQDFYTFAPASRSFNNLNDHQTANFTGVLSPATNPGYVLEFDGSPMTVDYGLFWPQGSPLGHFFWEFWAMPGQDTYNRYLVSDGYGSEHALLFGFSYGDDGHYNLMGDIFDGSNVTYFLSDEGPSAGEWGHYAVGWDGKNIVTYYDGVPVGKQMFVGPRISPGLGFGASLLAIGGSDHQNLVGRIAQVRGYEASNPREGSMESSFAPQTLFAREGQLLSYFFRPSPRVADLSAGYIEGTHPGTLRGFDIGYRSECASCSTPRFVIDPTAPNFSNPNNSGQNNAPSNSPPSPPTPPAGARVFDSFSRANSTYILGNKGGLGATEGGSAGQLAWQTNLGTAPQPQPFGILSGHAVLLADVPAVAWVSTGATSIKVSVDRTLGRYGTGQNTGLCFRVKDGNNLFFAYTSDDESDPAGAKKLSLGYFQDGVRTVLAHGISMPSSKWRSLRVVTLQSGTINVYADGDLIYSTSSAIFADSDGDGLFSNGSGLALTNRWDNFTVLDAQ